MRRGNAARKHLREEQNDITVKFFSRGVRALSTCAKRLLRLFCRTAWRRSAVGRFFRPLSLIGKLSTTIYVKRGRVIAEHYNFLGDAGSERIDANNREEKYEQI